MKLFGIEFFKPVFVITGCEARGDHKSKYLTRYRIIEKLCTETEKGFGRYLHIFHRSDSDDAFHDHPWDFTTFILWGGYREYSTDGTYIYRQTLAPLTAHYRPATWRHRVVLHKDRYGREKTAVTIVFRGPKLRSWGFWRRGEFTHYKDYFRKMGC